MTGTKASRIGRPPSPTRPLMGAFLDALRAGNVEGLQHADASLTRVTALETPPQAASAAGQQRRPDPTRAARQRAKRWRDKHGLDVFRFDLDGHQIAALLVDRGVLSLEASADKAQVQAAAQRLVSQFFHDAVTCNVPPGTRTLAFAGPKKPQ